MIGEFSDSNVRVRAVATLRGKLKFVPHCAVLVTAGAYDELGKKSARF